MIVLKNEKKHELQVSDIQKLLRRGGEKFSYCTSGHTSNTLRNGSYKKKTQKIDLSSLDGILAIDENELWVAAEPRVTMKTLCKATLRHGMIPLVLPEFTSITVGGAIMGAAIESSSFQYGQFNDTCLEVELLLGDGSKIKASKAENSDLFFALAGSYGTLALLTLAKIKLKKIQPYVRVSCSRFSSPKDLIDALKAEKASDFLDAVVLAKNDFVLMRGTVCNSIETAFIRTQRYGSKWFYQHLHKADFTLPIFDYLFRFDKGAFWMGNFLLSLPLFMQALCRYKLKNIPEKIKKGAHKAGPFQKSNPSFLFRLLFDRFFSSSALYHLWHKVPQKILENLFFIHDFYVPIDQAEKALCSFMESINIFPIWLCPVKGTQENQFLSPHFGKEFFLNMGYYGVTQKNSLELSKVCENAILSFGGRKMLYSYTYYTHEQFQNIYPAETYDALRKKYHGHQVFPTLYEKVVL